MNLDYEIEKINLKSKDIRELLKEKEFKNNFEMLSETYEYFKNDPYFNYLDNDNITTFNGYLYKDTLIGITSYRIPEYSYLPTNLKAQYLDSIEIHKEYQSKGFGSKILSNLTDNDIIWVANIDDYNYDFYLKNGFEILTPEDELSWSVKNISKDSKIVREYLTKPEPLLQKIYEERINKIISS